MNLRTQRGKNRRKENYLFINTLRLVILIDREIPFQFNFYSQTLIVVGKQISFLQWCALVMKNSSPNVSKSKTVPPRFGMQKEKYTPLNFTILKGKFDKSYRIQKIEEIIFSRLLMYLQRYLSYRDVQYLILKLETNCFDLFLSTLVLRVIFLDLQSKIHV